jgi:sulfur-carrier protein
MRQYTGGAETLSLEGETVGVVLNNLVADANGIEGRLFKGGAATPTLNRFVNIYVNDEDIRFLQNLDTPLKPGDVISIVPAIAGG